MISRKVHSICSFISIYRNGYTETQKKKKKIILMNIFTDRIRVYLLRFFLLNRFLFSSALNIFATIAVIQQNISELHFSLFFFSNDNLFENYEKQQQQLIFGRKKKKKKPAVRRVNRASWCMLQIVCSVGF